MRTVFISVRASTSMPNIEGVVGFRPSSNLSFIAGTVTFLRNLTGTALQVPDTQANYVLDY